MSHADEMHALVYFHDDPNNENYDEYTLRYSNTVRYFVQMMDVFNDLMISNNIDPVECRRFP
jgi:predicted adenine nucleotide alpha hydrolase (AANH) superfamily ATPase